MNTTTVNVGNATVEYVGTTETFAWIKFSNGLQIDLTKSALEAIVDGFNRDKRINEFCETILSLGK